MEVPGIPGVRANEQLHARSDQLPELLPIHRLIVRGEEREALVKRFERGERLLYVGDDRLRQAALPGRIVEHLGIRPQVRIVDRDPDGRRPIEPARGRSLANRLEDVVGKQRRCAQMLEIVDASREALANLVVRAPVRGNHEPHRHRAMTWAQRLKRVFAIDIERCWRFDGRVRARLAGRCRILLKRGDSGGAAGEVQGPEPTQFPMPALKCAACVASATVTRSQ